MNRSMMTAPGAALALLALAVPAAAQVPGTPRALGMGGAYVASARGHEALLANPANLGLPGTPHWSLAFPQLGLGGTLLGPALSDVADLANYDGIDQGRKDALLAAVPESGAELRTDWRHPLVAIQSGRFAVGVTYGLVGEHTVGKDLVDLVLNGYQEGRTDYEVGRTEGSRATFFDIAAGYGRRVGPVSVGVTGHYIRGRTLMRSKMFEPRFDLTEQEISIDYVGVLSDGGTGYGVDVGVAYQPSSKLTLSAAVANAWSRMKWSEDLRVRSVTLNRSELEGVNEPWWIRDEYERSDAPLDPTAVSYEVYETALPLFEEAYFPATLRLGGEWAPTGGTQIGAAYQAHLTSGRLGGWWDRTLSVGVQQKLPLIRARAGFATNLEDGTMLTGGLSLGPLEIGVAKLDDAGWEDGRREGLLVTFGVGIRTPGTMQ